MRLTSPRFAGVNGQTQQKQALSAQPDTDHAVSLHTLTTDTASFPRKLQNQPRFGADVAPWGGAVGGGGEDPEDNRRPYQNPLPKDAQQLPDDWAALLRRAMINAEQRAQKQGKRADPNEVIFRFERKHNLTLPKFIHGGKNGRQIRLYNQLEATGRNFRESRNPDRVIANTKNTKWKPWVEPSSAQVTPSQNVPTAAQGLPQGWDKDLRQAMKEEINTKGREANAQDVMRAFQQQRGIKLPEYVFATPTSDYATPLDKLLNNKKPKILNAQNSRNRKDTAQWTPCTDLDRVNPLYRSKNSYTERGEQPPLFLPPRPDSAEAGPSTAPRHSGYVEPNPGSTVSPGTNYGAYPSHPAGNQQWQFPSLQAGFLDIAGRAGESNFSTGHSQVPPHAQNERPQLPGFRQGFSAVVARDEAEIPFSTRHYHFPPPASSSTASGHHQNNSEGWERSSDGDYMRYRYLDGTYSQWQPSEN
jgi:hypothetical protein